MALAVGLIFAQHATLILISYVLPHHPQVVILVCQSIIETIQLKSKNEIAYFKLTELV